MLQGRIAVVEPTGVRRSMPLTARGVTIGRDSNNDVVVSYPFISRSHARITFDGQNYYVTDLDSANGSYLGHARLVPNTPTLWYPGTPLHVGDVLFHIDTQGGVQGDTGNLKKREKQKTEVINWAGSPEAVAAPQSQRSNMTWIIAGLVIVVLLALCVVVAAGLIIFFVSA
jgi:pSer/pThr/pTyr-binding forkhead associated (FHA) protein